MTRGFFLHPFPPGSSRKPVGGAWISALAVLVGVGLGLAVLVPASHAQITSTLQGRVTDSQGAAIPGAIVRVSSSSLAVQRQVTADASGDYRVVGLLPGIYSINVTKSGFATYKVNDIEVTLNRTLTLNAMLKVAAVETQLEVAATVPLLETTTSSSGGTITPTQIANMPINGRDYLDLMQLVPGVTINRQNATVRSANQVASGFDTADAANPILGERAGNAMFLIDGMPNTDEVSGGAASQFNQESILEFQVITAGYKAEFGHGSGGVINVVSKSGTNQWHGAASLYHRNYKLDSSNIPGQKDAPFLLRWDPSLQLGGPIKKDKIFFFGSAERIRESRSLNFQFPAATPPVLIAQETPFNLHSQTYDLRLRAKLDEQFGHHRLTQQANWTNTQITDYLPLSQGTSLPSQRSNIDSRHLILGFSDTATLGDQSNPFLLNMYFQYRGEPTRTQAAHPEAGVANTLDNLFSSLNTGQLFGDLGSVSFGYGFTPTTIDQKYTSFGASLAKHHSRHNLKFGWDFQHMAVDGTEFALLFNQLFATEADLVQFGPNDAGVYLLQTPAFQTPKDSLIALRNNYTGFYVQDDLNLLKNLTVNAGVRWDYDSRFPTHGTVSPRVGMAWSITPKTILRGSWGLFYDHFRLGLARDIPGFGGANQLQQTFFSLPRLFYGNPSTLLALFSAIGFNTPCTSSTLTDAQIGGAPCPLNPSKPFFGIDHLNSVVAAGHAPIPANAVVNINNVQQLTGLTPEQFADQAAVALGQAPGYFTWDPLGHLGADTVIAAFPVPVTVDPGFKVPYSSAYQIGLQRELTPNLVVSADYYHRDIRHILGVRDTNLAFESRVNNKRTFLPGTPQNAPITGFGPWYAGEYNGFTLSIRKRLSHRFALETSYSWADATDNVGAYTGTGTARPSDSFVGTPPAVTQAGTAAGPCAHPGVTLSNADGPFIAANCNPVPQAGKFYNGPNLDSGHSDLGLKHTVLLNGIFQLPWSFEFSGIFRVQSGFRYSRSSLAFIDIDGNTQTNGIDHCLAPTTTVTGCATTPVGTLARNAFTAPTFTNLDVRLTKRFKLGERASLHAMLEFFNVVNAGNPAAVQQTPPGPGDTSTPPFGSVLQRLPGREGQVGLRFEF